MSYAIFGSTYSFDFRLDQNCYGFAFKKKKSFRHVQILKLLDYFHFIFFLLFYVILGHKIKLNLI